MPAPKGNKFGAKENPKTRHFHMLFRPDAFEKIKKIAQSEKISVAQVIEKSLLASYPHEMDGLF